MIAETKTKTIYTPTLLRCSNLKPKKWPDEDTTIDQWNSDLIFNKNHGPHKIRFISSMEFI